MRPPLPALLLLLTLAVALAPPVARAQEAPVLVDLVTEDEVAVQDGAAASFTVRLQNLNPERPFFVSLSAEGFSGWTLGTERPRFLIEPAETRDVLLTLSAPARPPEATQGALVVQVVNVDSGATTRHALDVRVRVLDAHRVLGVFENPLPPPLDNDYGVFALDLAFWAVFGVASFLTNDTVVRYLTRRTRVEVTRVIIAKLRWPIFTFVMLLGVQYSFRVLPRNPLTLVIDRFFAAIAIGVVGVYVAYRIIDSVLYYYSAEIAPRTDTKVDDILAPAFRKISVAILTVIAVGYTLSVVGVNLSVLFGAAGIAGLVIAFAAQDTLSNFFGGVFLLIDRPFIEGDDIQLETGERVRVDRIGLRSTRLYHRRTNEMIVLPNNQLASRRIVNMSATDRRHRVHMEIPVAYGSDPEKVKAVVRDAILKAPGVSLADEPVVYFWAFQEWRLVFAARFFAQDYRQRHEVSSQVRSAIVAAFRREGIVIPVPQHDVRVRGSASPPLAEDAIRLQP